MKSILLTVKMEMTDELYEKTMKEYNGDLDAAAAKVFTTEFGDGWKMEYVGLTVVE
jgi:hypothetical protein